MALFHTHVTVCGLWTGKPGSHHLAFLVLDTSLESTVNLPHSGYLPESQDPRVYQKQKGPTDIREWIALIRKKDRVAFGFLHYAP